MRLTFLTTTLVVVATLSSLSAPLAAQTAVRCDVNGQTVYSDKPCPPGTAAKVIAPIQETPEQRAAAQSANAQIRKDNASVDKRLDDRLKRETTHVATRAAPDKAAAEKPKRGKAIKAKVSKAKAKKAAKSGKSKAKQDTNAYRQKP
jgi:hypothetical protein